MPRKSQTALPNSNSAENRSADTSAEEIIGILTAISIVSKRMAKKLALLEQESTGKVTKKRYV